MLTQTQRIVHPDETPVDGVSEKLESIQEVRFVKWHTLALKLNVVEKVQRSKSR